MGPLVTGRQEPPRFLWGTSEVSLKPSAVPRNEGFRILGVSIIPLALSCDLPSHPTELFTLPANFALFPKGNHQHDRIFRPSHKPRPPGHPPPPIPILS